MPVAIQMNEPVDPVRSDGQKIGPAARTVVMRYPPAYQLVINDILARIRSGEWREGQKIPSLASLEKAYPQSRMTLYKALQHLSERGYLTMTRGRGTFVKAANPRARVGILTGSQVFDQGVMPFAVQVLRHASAYLTRCGMDSQVYTEDPLTPTHVPVGLEDDLDREKLAGLLTVTATFPWNFMATERWKRLAVPHVNLGPGPAPYGFDVDRHAFVTQALDLARQRGRRCAALLERHEHLRDHLAGFEDACRQYGLSVCATPATVPSPGLTYEEYGYELLHRVWATDPRPDVVVVPDDVIAKGVSQAAAMLSIRDELLVIALTNRGSRLFYPVPVTAFEVDVGAMVALAARTLIDLINGVKPQSRIVLVPPVLPFANKTEPERNAPAIQAPTEKQL